MSYIQITEQGNANPLLPRRADQSAYLRRQAENDMDILLGYVEWLIDHEVSAKPLLSHVDEAVHPLCNQGTTSNATRQHAQTLPLTTEICNR